MIDRDKISRALFGKSKYVFWLSLALVLLVYMLLVFYFEPPHVIFGDLPLSGRDLDTHVEQAYRVTEALDGWGKSWAYDPQMLAGYPNGTIFDADNKAWELWTFALWKMGMPKGLAFNLFVLFAHLMCPIVIFSSARMFGLNRSSALVAMSLGLAVWFFDGFIHWAWWEGMTAYSIAGFLFLLPLALFYNYLADRRRWRVILLAVVMALGHLIHPYIFFMLALPMVALYASRFRSLKIEQHLSIVMVVVLTIAVNWYWLAVAIRFWHYIMDSGYLGASTLGHLFTDYFGLVSDRSVTGGAGMRSGFRFISLAAAAVTLFYWKKDRDERFLAFAVGLISLFIMTYLGGYFRFGQQVQPYRFAAPLVFLSLIPAAHLVQRIVETRALAGLPLSARVLGVVILLVVAPRLIRDVLYFIPDGVPKAAELEDEKPRVTDMIGFGNIGYPEHKSFAHEPIHEDFLLLAWWLENHKGYDGRVAVENWTLGELLAWKTDMQVLGGFRLRNLQHSAANFFRRYPISAPPMGKLRRFLETYAVRYVIASVTFKRFDNTPNVLTRVAEIGHHVIFESMLPVNFFAQGSGQVKASMNLISVTGTDPEEDVVLRYHWLETLRCKDSNGNGACDIVREPVMDNPVGFMRIPAGHPADFEIVNEY